MNILEAECSREAKEFYAKYHDFLMLTEPCNNSIIGWLQRKMTEKGGERCEFIAIRTSEGKPQLLALLRRDSNLTQSSSIHISHGVGDHAANYELLLRYLCTLLRPPQQQHRCQNGDHLPDRDEISHLVQIGDWTLHFDPEVDGSQREGGYRSLLIDMVNDMLVKAGVKKRLQLLCPTMLYILDEVNKSILEDINARDSQHERVCIASVEHVDLITEWRFKFYADTFLHNTVEHTSKDKDSKENEEVSDETPFEKEKQNVLQDINHGRVFIWMVDNNNSKSTITTQQPPQSSNHHQEAENNKKETEDHHYFYHNHTSKVVSMAMISRETPNCAHISNVYTPPDERGKGYATRLVAAMSQYAKEKKGKRFCTLNTDLTNPTSNHIYTNIGYRPLCKGGHFKVS